MKKHERNEDLERQGGWSICLTWNKLLLFHLNWTWIAKSHKKWMSERGFKHRRFTYKSASKLAFNLKHLVYLVVKDVLSWWLVAIDQCNVQCIRNCSKKTLLGLHATLFGSSFQLSQIVTSNESGSKTKFNLTEMETQCNTQRTSLKFK